MRQINEVEEDKATINEVEEDKATINEVEEDKATMPAGTILSMLL